MESKNDLRILLVGHTGHGKSATGNSLLGITNIGGFDEKMSPVSVTATPKRLVGQRFGRTLEVVDTPGFFDTSLEDQFVYEQIARCVGMTLPGFNAIFLILRAGRFTEELVQTVEIFFKLFGRSVDKYTFVLFTYIDTEEDMEHYIKGFDKKPEDSTVKAFQVLKKRCQGKLLFIDNQSNKEIKEEMVWNILTAVDTANAQSLRPYFSNKLTRQMEKRAQDFHWMHVSGLGLERSKEDLRILLMGLPGHGKSATGNSLLGKSLFTENASTVGNAYHQTHSEVINGRKIQIAEFPVENPSVQSEADLTKQLLQTEKILQPGFHAVCFVINPNKISDVKYQFLQPMKYFGDDANDYAFVIMTFSKSEEEFEERFRSNIQAKHPVTSVLKYCKDKRLYIDNKAELQEKNEILEDIVNFIDCENAKKVTPYFSSRFKQTTEASETAKTEEAAKAAEAAKKAEIEHNEELLRVRRETFETYKRDLEKNINEQNIKTAEAKQQIQKLEYEVRLTEIAKKNLEEKAAKAEHQEQYQKELDKKEREKLQREHKEQEEKHQRERKKKDEKRRRELEEQAEKYKRQLKEQEDKIKRELKEQEETRQQEREKQEEKHRNKRKEQEEKLQRQREEQEDKYKTELKEKEEKFKSEHKLHEMISNRERKQQEDSHQRERKLYEEFKQKLEQDLKDSKDSKCLIQ